jgi:low affinity Fe/Cu permease
VFVHRHRWVLPDMTQQPQPVFTRLSRAASNAVGRPLAFILAAATVVVWALTGPLFSFNATWQLTINTGTTIVTFLMVFLIQTSQNRDTQAIQLKLDELIHITLGADDRLLDLEELGEEELRSKRDVYEAIARTARSNSSFNTAQPPVSNAGQAPAPNAGPPPESNRPNTEGSSHD